MDSIFNKSAFPKYSFSTILFTSIRLSRYYIACCELHCWEEIITFADILELVFYPIREVFKLLQNQAIADFIGFTVLDLAITGLVILIVSKFLLNPSTIRKTSEHISNGNNPKGGDVD